MYDIDISRDQIDEGVDRMLASPNFQSSPRLAQILRFIVDETLSGNADRLKAFYIANKVFGRDENFDAATDPLVRVQANRLRKAIERYYLARGVDDPIRITVPKGRYAAKFERVSALSTDTRAPVLSQPTVAVLPFVAIGDDGEQDYFADGLTEELTTALAQVENFAVISRHSTYQIASTKQDVREIGQALNVRFIIEGTVQRAPKALRVTAQLTDASNGVQVWADSFSSKLRTADFFDIQDEIVSAVTSRVADAFGVIPRLLERETRGKRARSLDAYDALLRFFHYQTHLGADTYDWARRGLEKAVERDQEYAPALAALAELACDNLSLRYHEPYDRLEEAYEYARRAVSADPACQLAHYSMAFVHFHRKNRDGCLQSAQQVIDLNPNAPYFVGVAGWLIALTGDWDRGLGVLRESIKRNPFYPGWFNLAPFQYHFFREEYEAALAAAERMILPGLPWDPLTRLAAYSQLGQKDRASAVLQQLNREFPDFPEYARDYLSSYVFADEHVEILHRALLDAGLNAN